MSQLFPFRIYLQCLLIVGFLSIHSNVSYAATKQSTEALPVVEQSWVITQIIQLQDRSARLEALFQLQTLNSSDMKDAEKELQQLQLQLVELKEKLVAQADSQSKELASYDRRISDINFYTNFWGAVLAVFGLIITITAIAMGWSAKNRAVSEATKAAREYFNSEGKSLIEAEQARFENARELEIATLRCEHEALHQELKSQSELLIAQSFFSKAESFEKDDNPDAAIAEYDGLVARFIDSESIDIKEKISLSLFRKASIFNKSDKLADANLAYDELVSMFIEDESPKINYLVAAALANKGMTQGKLNLLEAAVDTYHKLVSRFDRTTDLKLIKVVAVAQLNKGVAQGRLNQPEAAIKTFNELVCRVTDETELVLKEQVAKALVNKGVAQGRLNHPEAAIETFNGLVCRFGGATELVLKEQVANALLYKGMEQGQLNQPEAAMETYNELVRRFDGASELVLKEQVARALVNKGGTQYKLKQPEAAMETYNELVRRFGNATELVLKEMASNAYNGIGFARLSDGKEHLMKDNVEQAEANFKQALEYFDKGLIYLEPESLSGLILGNRAYALALLGDVKLAEDVFVAGLRAPVDGGETLYEATLSDFEIHPLPQDEPMKELVERQWKMWVAEHDSKCEDTFIKQPNGVSLS